MGAKKNFVLDTNVILHDYKCIENFQENDIYLPLVVLGVSRSIIMPVSLFGS